MNVSVPLRGKYRGKYLKDGKDAQDQLVGFRPLAG